MAIPAQVNALREIASEIEWAKVLEISPDNYQEQAVANNRIVKLPNSKGESENLSMIAQVYEAYESLKKQERSLDFEDVLLLTVGMLEEDRQLHISPGDFQARDLTIFAEVGKHPGTHQL